MATIDVTRVQAEGRTHRYTWANIGQGDTPSSMSIPGAADKSIQFTGTFSGATVTVQGSNEASPSNWAILTDAQGNSLSFTDVGLESVTEMTTHIRLSVTGGDVSTDVTAILLARSTM